MKNLQTGNIVVYADGQRGLVVKNVSDKAEDCQLNPCLVIMDLNGNIIKIIKNEQDVAEVLKNEVLTGAAEDL